MAFARAPGIVPKLSPYSDTNWVLVSGLIAPEVVNELQALRMESFKNEGKKSCHSQLKPGKRYIVTPFTNNLIN